MPLTLDGAIVPGQPRRQMFTVLAISPMKRESVVERVASQPKTNVISGHADVRN